MMNSDQSAQKTSTDPGNEAINRKNRSAEKEDHQRSRCGTCRRRPRRRFPCQLCPPPLFPGHFWSWTALKFDIDFEMTRMQALFKIPLLWDAKSLWRDIQ